MFIQGFIKARRPTCQGFTNSFPSFSSSSYWTINLKNVAVKAIFTARTRVVRSKRSAVQKQPRNYLTRNKEESFFFPHSRNTCLDKLLKIVTIYSHVFHSDTEEHFNCNSACLWAELCEENITSRVGKINDYELF